MWKIAFKKLDVIWSAKSDYAISNFLKAVFHKFYLVHSWISWLIIAALHHQPRQQLPTLVGIIFWQEPGMSSLIFLFLQPLHLVIRRSIPNDRILKGAFFCNFCKSSTTTCMHYFLTALFCSGLHSFEESDSFIKA